MDPFAEEEISAASFDPMQVLRKFWRRKVLFFVPFVICLCMAAWVVSTMEPIYYSSAQVRVMMNQNQSLLLEERGYRPSRDQDREALATIWTIVTGPKFLENIVQGLQLHREILATAVEPGIDPEALEDWAIDIRGRLLGRDIRVEQNGSHLFEIGVYDPDPELAYTIARELLDRFLEEERASRLQPSTQTRDFLTERRGELVTRLDEAERALTSFQQTMMSQDLTGSLVNELNLGVAEVELGRMRTHLQDAGAGNIFTLEQRTIQILGTVPRLTGISGNTAIAAVTRDLAEVEFGQVRELISPTGEADETGANSGGALRIRLNDLVAQYVDDHFPERGFADRNALTEYFYQRLYHDVRQQVVNRLATAVDEYRSFRQRSPEQSATLTRLQERVESAREMVTAIERQINQESIRVEASMAEIGYRIVVRRDPELPRQPSEPDKVKLAFMGFVLSLGMGIGLVVLAILLDRSLGTVVEIEKRLGLPVIGTLPIVENPHFEAQKKRRFLIWGLVVLGITAVAAFGFLYVYPRLK